MNRERLQLMVEMLEEVEAGTWVPTDDTNLPSMLRPTESVSFNMRHWGGPKGLCGYAACAVGHACMDSRFPRLDNKSELSIAPRCGAEVGWGAVYRFFDLTAEEAKHLFSDEKYAVTPSPRCVIARINTLLRQ